MTAAADVRISVPRSFFAGIQFLMILSYLPERFD